MEENIIEIYKKYSEINPFKNKGLGDNFRRLAKNSKIKYEYYIPKEFSVYNKDEWVIDSRLKKHLKPDITRQIYYDLVFLGITSPTDRPKCKFCRKECRFEFRFGYCSYCYDKSCKTKHVGQLTSLKLKGRPLSELNKLHLSQAKKGKKLTEEQRLRRPRGYHFHLSAEAREKISLSKKGKVKSRNYYTSGKFDSKKFNKEIEYLSSYEKDFLSICENSKYIVGLEIPDPIKYKFNNEVHRYYPDFLLELDSGFKVMVEVKANNLLNDKKVIMKRLYAKKWCKENNIKYITLTEKDIYSYFSKTTRKIKFDLDLYKYFY